MSAPGYDPIATGNAGGGGGQLPPMPDGPPIAGGRPMGGLFPGDVQMGLSKNLTGWGASSIMNGGLFGLGSSSQKAPGFIARIMQSIAEDMRNLAKNQASTEAITGSAPSTNGPPDLSALTAGISAPSISGGEPVSMASSGMLSSGMRGGGGGIELG